MLLRRQFPSSRSRRLVAMATVGGARALGLDALGSIAPGKRAALAFAPGSGTEGDPHEFLLSGEARLQPVSVS